MNGTQTRGVGHGGAFAVAALMVWSVGVCGAARAAGAGPLDQIRRAASQTPLDKALLSAALRGDAARAEDLLALGANLETRDPAGNTPLAWAASSGDAGAVGFLIAKGARVNVRNEYGVSPLARAAAVDSIAAVRVLLANGADPNIRDNAGRTVLMATAEAGQSSLIPLLRTAGADLEAVDADGRTALIHAAMRDINLHAAGNTPRVRRRKTVETNAVVRALLAAGARADIRGKDGRAARHWAARMKNETLVPLLSHI